MTPREKLLKDLAQQITTRMRARSGAELYQAGAFNLPKFPLQLAEQIFPSSSRRAS